MGSRGKQLAERLRKFNDDLTGFVESCSEETWRRVSPPEQWPIAVVARHVAGGHYSVLDLAKGMIAGQGLPELTSEAIDRMNAEHAREHADCTRDEVLRLLRDNGQALIDFAANASDEELDRRALLSMMDQEISVEQFLDMVIVQSGAEHLANMRAAAAR